MKPLRKIAAKPAEASQPSSETKAQPEPKPEGKPVQIWIEERRAEDARPVRDPDSPRSRGPRITDEVATFAARVDGHLKKMGAKP